MRTSRRGQKARLARLTAAGTRIELRAAYEIYDSRGERASVAAVAASLARLTCDAGREDEAEQLARVAEESAAAQAKVLTRRGELEAAERLARKAVSLTEGTQFPDWRAETLRGPPRASGAGRRARSSSG